MAYNPKIHHRKSIRKRGYDYSQAGLYFITICVQNRKCLFGDIVGVPLVGVPLVGTPIGYPKMHLNDAGRMVENAWLKIPQRFPNVQLHEYVVMPNHFHAIMEIIAGATLVVAQIQPSDKNHPTDKNETMGPSEKVQPQGIAPKMKPKTIGDMVGAFQSIATVEYIRGVKNLGWKPFNGRLWQRNYWEHIIRDKKSYQRISEYIINNPRNWKGDILNRK